MTGRHAPLGWLWFWFLLAASCAVAPPPGGSALVWSLDGRALRPPELAPATRARLEAELASARRDHDQRPNDVDAIIWLGRRTAYLWRFEEAIEIYTRGLAEHPDEPRLLRHRGHRWITLRRFDRAVEDLERAAELCAGRPDEVEPDGQPNAEGRPTSTLQSNVWYHLGLAYYLQGDFANARRSYEACMRVATYSDDMLVATADWLWMTLRRLGDEQAAAALLDALPQKPRVIENFAYRDRLRLYRGEIGPEVLLGTGAADDPVQLATQGYGVANWHFVHGRAAEARALWQELAASGQWNAFGCIAAEAELCR